MMNQNMGSVNKFAADHKNNIQAGLQKTEKKAFICIPGGHKVSSKTDGIVISMIGLLDGKPFTASWQAILISSILQKINSTTNIKKTLAYHRSIP